MKIAKQSTLSGVGNYLKQEMNKKVPVSLYKFSTEDEMYSTTANDGDIAIFCGNVEKNVFKDTSFNNIIIKNNLNVPYEILEEKKYSFFNNFQEKQLEITLSPLEIKVEIYNSSGSKVIKTYIYEADFQGANFWHLTSGEVGKVDFSSFISFISYLNENEWNSALVNVLSYIKNEVNVYIYNQASTSGSNWEKLITTDNDYTNKALVDTLINQAKYELPIASKTVLGGVKLSDSMTVSNDGTISPKINNTLTNSSAYQCLSSAMGKKLNEEKASIEYVDSKIWTGTQAEYDSIQEKNANTLYCITEEV